MVEANGDAGERPEMINDEPYGKGWLVKVRPSDPSEVEALLDAEEYRKLLSGA